MPIRRPRGGGRGVADGRVRRGQPEPPAVDGRHGAGPGAIAAAARPELVGHGREVVDDFRVFFVKFYLNQRPPKGHGPPVND